MSSKKSNETLHSNKKIKITDYFSKSEKTTTKAFQIEEVSICSKLNPRMQTNKNEEDEQVQKFELVKLSSVFQANNLRNLFSVSNLFVLNPNLLDGDVQRSVGDEFVKLPFDESFIIEHNGQSYRKWDLIKKVFCHDKIDTFSGLKSAIQTCNPKLATKHFDILQTLVDDDSSEENEYFFDSLLPAIIKLALSLPNLFEQSKIPKLPSGKSGAVFMSQQQVGSLLANAFLCTFPCNLGVHCINFDK